MIPNDILNKLEEISAPKCYNILSALGHTTIFVYHRGQIVYVKDWVMMDDIVWLPANKTPYFTFWGGPPNKLAYYQGTLYTLLLDRIYDYLLQHSIKQLSQVLGIPEQRKIQVWL
jgi:hypothetical protein